MIKKPFPTQFDGPEKSPGFLLWQVTQDWHRKICQALKPLELTHSQFVLLAGSFWLSLEGGPPSQAELSRFCNTDINVTSQVVRTLEKRGLLKREQPRDERSKCILVTAIGKKAIGKAIPLVEAIDRDFFKCLGKEQNSMTEKLALLAAQKNAGGLI